MSFSPFARYRNFTRDNLKKFLEVYPDMSSKMSWDDAKKDIEQKMPGYKRTAYQQACQFGLEDRSGNEFRFHSYLNTFDDEYLDRYIEFWIKTYYAPNPYINSTDAPIMIFCELAEEILLSPTHEVDYDNFFLTRMGGGSEDILMNAIKEYGSPLKYDNSTGVNVFSIDSKDVTILTYLINYIKTEFPLPTTNNYKYFYDRYSYENFCKFYGISSRVALEIPNIEYVSGYNPPTNFERNRIVFGAPGTGKSFLLNEDKKVLLSDDKDYERVTFHPDYTYSQFVGTYKPVTKHNGDIMYTFVPGPFMRIIAKAIKNIVDATDIKTGNVDVTKVKPFLLIIEEINRAKASAVFGDIFQLLDRSEKHVSEYDIHPSEEIKEYLMNVVGGKKTDFDTIRIPDNLFIWSTMNNADQGVFPLDTAFKRRWSFKYIGINAEEEDKKTKKSNVPGFFTLPNTKKIEWNALRKAINDLLSSDDVKVNEDKLLGPFFINTNKYLKAGSTDELVDDFYEIVESKVLMYLFEDAAKTKRGKVFANTAAVTRFSSLCNLFEDRDISIFKDIDGTKFEDKYNNYCVKKAQSPNMPATDATL